MYSLPQIGIDQFNDPTSDVRIDEELLILFYKNRTRIIQPFVEDKKLLVKPYNFRVSPSDNRIYDAVSSADLWHFSDEALEAFPIWRTRSIKTSNPDWVASRDDREVFALIDCALYMVHLLNIYEPNKESIYNIIFTKQQKDALGNLNDKPVLSDINRLIMRAAGSNRSMPHRQSYDILIFARIDMETSQVAKKDNKGIAFETMCAVTLKEAGYSTRLTDVTGDFGADIIAMIDDLTFAIQCKDTVRPVGIKGVQEAVGARAHYQTDYAVVCATGGFTDAAIALASSNGVALCSLGQLTKRLQTM